MDKSQRVPERTPVLTRLSANDIARGGLTNLVRRRLVASGAAWPSYSVNLQRSSAGHDVALCVAAQCRVRTSPLTAHRKSGMGRFESLLLLCRSYRDDVPARTVRLVNIAQG